MLTAYFTSRGKFHTDTGIYHAQAIRIIEEYGVIKGLANLQLHFGYNSAYFSFCALFTGSSILPSALHSTTGFIEALCLVYSIRNTKRYWKSSKSVVGASASIILYALINITGSMSPATDYVSLFMVLFVISEWCIAASQTREIVDKTSEVDRFIMPALMSVFVVSMKLSTGPMIILALYPLIILARAKKWRKMIWSVIMSITAVIPYLIRNVIISGWLLYPFEKIDLFNVEWKVPVEQLRKDAAQIEVWGKTLCDVAKQDMPASQWIPIWWSNQEHYDQMLIYAVVLSALLVTGIMIAHIIRREKINASAVVLYLAMYAVLIMWFVESPFVRYGLEVLIALPLITTGKLIDYRKGMQNPGFTEYFGGTIAALIFLCFAATLDHYATTDIVTAKHDLSEPYYLMQQPFADSETKYVEMNGNKIYYSVDGENNSYYNCPSSCYEVMMNNCELMGDTIKSGFRSRSR